MEAFELAAIVLGIALPLHLAVRWQLDRLADARYVRRSGAALASEDEVEARSEVIGHYAGRAIYAWVQFMGMRYRFHGVTRASYRDHVGERELFMEPGVLYVTD
jgi:hypothetical protein